MQPIREILEHAPDAIPVPEALRHRRVEYIIWPLDDHEEGMPETPHPHFLIADVDDIHIPSREERNARS